MIALEKNPNNQNNNFLCFTGKLFCLWYLASPPPHAQTGLLSVIWPVLSLLRSLLQLLRPQFYLSPKSFSFQWFCNQLLITTVSSPLLIGLPVANISSLSLYTISLFNESMTPICGPCLCLPLGPSRARDITTERWRKMSHLVLIQFDISCYGPFEAHTEPVLEIVTEEGAICLFCCSVSLSFLLWFLFEHIPHGEIIAWPRHNTQLPADFGLSSCTSMVQMLVWQDGQSGNLDWKSQHPTSLSRKTWLPNL